MSYHGRYIRSKLADNLPHLSCYREVELWHNAVKPFSKGRKVGQRPLGMNRKYDRFIVRREYDYKSNTPTQFDYIIKHYDTDILRYHADGSLTIKSVYDSISTTQALMELLGPEYFVRRKTKAYFKDRNGHFFRIRDGLKVNADKSVDEAVLATKPKDVIHEVDKAALKELRNQFTEFMEYVYFTNNLTQGGEGLSSKLVLEGVTDGDRNHNLYRKNAQVALSIDTTQIRWYRNPQFAVRQAFFAEVEAAMKIEDEQVKLEKYNHLATYLSFSASNKFTGSTWNQTGDDRHYKWEVDNRRLRQFFDGLLKFRFPTLVLKEVEVPHGVIRHDTNAKYFEYGTL